MANWYVNSVAYTAVAQWAATHAYSSTSNGGRGDYVRQLAAPSVGNERVFRCTTAGTSLSAEPAWNLGHNATTTEAAGPVWTECTGQEADQIVGSWNAPHARLRNALASGWAAAGDNVYCSSNHAATQASALTITSLGTPANPINIIAINSALPNVPPLSGDLVSGINNGASASETCTSGAHTWSGWLYNYGVKVLSSSTSNSIILSNASGNVQKFEQTTISGGGGSTPTIFFAGGGLGSVTDWINVTYTGTSTGLLRILGGYGSWRGGSSTVNQSLFTQNTNDIGSMFVEGIDFTASASGKKLVIAGTASAQVNYVFKDCRYTAGVTIDTPIGPCSIDLVRTDSGGTNYVEQRYRVWGTQIDDIAVVRTGTADGTPKSRKVTTTANAKFQFPFECVFTAIKNQKTNTPINVTMYGIWFGSALPLNSELWFDVEYLASSSNSQGTISTGAAANLLAAGASLTADTSAWDTAGTVAAWQANTAIAVGQIRKSTGTNAGRLFQVTSISGTGTTGNSDPFAGVVDGGSVTDNPGGNQVVWQAGWRFSQTITVTPQQAGYVYGYPKAGKASATYWLDPPLYLS